MDLATLSTALESWLNVTAVDVNGTVPVPLPVEFGRIPKKVHTKPFVLVYLGPISQYGIDFPRYTYDELTDEYVEQMRGVRRIPVRFSFRSFDQGWGKNARQYAEDFRIRLTKQSAMEALGDAKLSLQETSDLVETDYEYSGRLISQVDMTVYFGIAAYERLGTDDAGYIRHVNITQQSIVMDEYGKPITDQQGNPVISEDERTIYVTADEAP